MAFDNNSEFEKNFKNFLKSISEQVIEEEFIIPIENNLKKRFVFENSEDKPESLFNSLTVRQPENNIWLEEFIKQAVIALRDEFVCKIMTDNLNSICVALSKNNIFLLNVTKL